MPLDADAPSWARELALAYESGANGLFVLYGNVADRYPLQGRLVSLGSFLDQQLLSGFEQVFLYDPGNGLSTARVSEAFQKWPGAQLLGAATREPRAAVELVTRYLRYRANLSSMGRDKVEHIAVIMRGADQLLPANRQGEFETASLASLVRDWASEAPFTELPFACFLVADNLNDLHPMVAGNPRVVRVRVPLPDAPTIDQALAQLRVDHPRAFAESPNEALGPLLSGVSITALQALVKVREHEGRALTRSDWIAAKKQMVEADAAGLIEFIESKKTLDQYHAQEALKAWLRQDIKLWHAHDLRAMPMGYIFCGPVGTGKTYLVECLAGEAGVPVVKLKNFRDRWVGSSEGNLEKIFRLIRALGRCIVFIDEADQALGKRESGSGDSGLSGRLYSMIAQEMSDGANRGRVVWILATSRPDLIEVDLKRPGRIDVKVPLLPTTTRAESAQLLVALLKRLDLKLEPAELAALELPLLLTPGAAEALSVKVYRRFRTSGETPLEALKSCLVGYQPPVAPDVLEFQMRIAIREATDMQFVPESLRALGQGWGGVMKYWWSAFNARPLGMPVPPNWFALAAIGLLGVFVHPGIWLIGAGLEIAYLKLLSGNPRFRKTVDAEGLGGVPVLDPEEARYNEMLGQLSSSGRRKHQEIEARAADILDTLKRTPMLESHRDSVEQLVWLHLRLLVAETSIRRVTETARKESTVLADQEKALTLRLEDPAISPELKRSLEQQQAVIDQRQQGHEDAARRLEQVDAELTRVDHQMALIREQSLLASDDGAVGASLNALTSSFNETQRWLSSQRDLFGAFEPGLGQRLPSRVLKRQPPVLSAGEIQ